MRLTREEKHLIRSNSLYGKQNSQRCGERAQLGYVRDSHLFLCISF